MTGKLITHRTRRKVLAAVARALVSAFRALAVPFIVILAATSITATTAALVIAVGKLAKLLI